ncbi:aldehyde dehydrogenase family protein [Mycobacterium sp. SM1]|uniref:aldehyde dehydrogenase family protein n=1 Tax=Mycobacterium sp. SM1 TaxID=2816243 RepID=UPI001BD1B9E8|nr:aldehyde dehydrogenase family protein [Mycobacterium sp. SM1]MBS4730410.1 aldehyde dehydrogenase family protein [Mycobacterium sp. SM1]
MTMVLPAFIDGRPLVCANTYDNIDPSSGSSLGPVSQCGVAEVDEAVAAARRVQPQWEHTSPEDRARLLTKLADLIERDAESLALLECEDTGKPLSQARADALVCARYFRFYGHAIDSYYGVTIPLGPGVHAYTRREPFGVTGHIVAWNYPMQLFGRAVAPAIATGNCSVVKPADETPRTAVAIAELATGAGLPAGVLNVVPGIGPEAGAALSTHPGVDHIGFVGSTQIGMVIAHAAAERVVPVVLELGGKSAQIVFPDADLNTAATFVVKAILQNAGQTCSAGSRLLVHESVHDQLLSRVAKKFAAVRIGPGRSDPDLGPLVSRKQQSRVKAFLDNLTKGEVVVGGGIPQAPELSGGAYFEPTLIDGVDPEAEIAQQEIFGPVVVANTFTSEEEAISLANGTQYALLGAVWTADVSRAHRLAAQIRAGQVYVNTYGAGGGVELPFGGFQKSGYGREKGYQALDTFTATKTIVIKL